MHSLIVALALTTATSAIAAEATATRLDGTTVGGELTSWTDQALSVTTKDGPVQLAAADLLSIRWSSTAPDEVAADKFNLSPAVELVDGTILPIDKFIRKNSSVKASLRGGLPATDKIARLPDAAISAAQLQPLQGEAAKQWQEIRTQGFPSDLLVLLKRDGKSLDYVEGTIGDVTAERIDFKLEGEMRSVDRSKVAGLIFYRPDRPPGAEPLCVLAGRDGLQARVAKIALEKGSLRILTVGGADLKLPLSDVQLADFSGGKVVFLSDTEPATEERTPLVGLPAGATLAVEYGRPRRDHSAFGGPLTLMFPGSDSAAPAGHLKSFSRGLAVRSRTTLVYRVPNGFTRLLGIAGIEPSTRGDGSAQLIISGDDRRLLETELTGAQSPQVLELDIKGVKRLRIVVDYGQNLDTGDWVNLCDLRMVK